ncbi:MAG: histidine phosphatase family protein [Streptococcaceae bacterium]|jgi:probable phosphoglycerate mutase|nr:histidine phosphatase family protein [Streptococcaceae bacterium]
MKIYFVRHGKTQWNLEKRLQGQFGDSALLPETYLEQERVKAFLAPVKFDKVFVSPKKRAVDTAAHITDLPLHPDMRLAEWNFGDLEGMKVEEAVKLYPEALENSRHHLEKFDGSAFGAEKVETVLARFESLLLDCVKFDKEGVFLWVGHGATGTAGLRHLAGFPVSELRAAGGLDNNSVSLLEGEPGQFVLKEWNRKL